MLCYLEMKAKNNLKDMDAGQRLGFRTAALTMWEGGSKAPRIAKTLGLNRRTVQTWTAGFAARGAAPDLSEAKRGPKPGTAASLAPGLECKIRRTLVDRTPDQLKFRFALWTSEAVRDMIAGRFGVALSRRSVRRYLAKWGFTPQRPARRARERDDAATRRWIASEYPKIKRAAERERAVIYWGDESCVKASGQRPRGYAPKGKTPVFKSLANQGCRVNIISAVSNTGKVRFMLGEQAVNAAVFKRFLGRLVRDSPRKVFLIVDNLRVHHAKALRPWLEKQEKRLRLFYLPSYSPEINPDEYLNQDVKQAVNKKPGARHKAELGGFVREHLLKRARQPQVVMKFFSLPEVAYAS
jgi:transposase